MNKSIVNAQTYIYISVPIIINYMPIYSPQKILIAELGIYQVERLYYGVVTGGSVCL